MSNKSLENVTTGKAQKGHLAFEATFESANLGKVDFVQVLACQLIFDIFFFVLVLSTYVKKETNFLYLFLTFQFSDNMFTSLVLKNTNLEFCNPR